MRPSNSVMPPRPSISIRACSSITHDSDTITLYDVVTGAKAGELKRAQAQFHSVAFAPDGRTLVTIADARQAGDGQDEVELWDVPTRQARHRLTSDGLVGPNGATFSPDGVSRAP